MKRIAATLALIAATGVVPSYYGDLHWRFIGPLRGGRTVALAGVPDRPNLFYIAAVNGGIWKTEDAGRTWRPIFDGEPTGSIGALAVSPSDPRIVYAGSGEGLQRPDLAVGDGVYKSSDGGATWTHLGLRDGQQIASMAIDAKNPNRLFVAVLGHPYGPNQERGIYRTLDGGASFTRVLYTNDNTGAFDVVIDPNDPQTIYATLWAARQAPWEIGASFEIAGSGIYKSSDGGSTWRPLTNGLPARVGRTEVAVAPSDSHIVYVYADAENKGDEAGALYRSADGGERFTRVNDAAEIAQRGDDLVSLAVAPNDPQSVYLTNTSTYRSTDGGRSMVAIKGAPGGDDYHTVWINPRDPQIIALASDQGATISVDGGATWSSWYNQPTAQMYHVNADNRFPYWVCGGQQESGSACVVSRGNWGEITERDWHTVGAQEYGYVVPDPLHPGITYGGKLEKHDERTDQTQEVSPIALPTKTYRVVRTEPIAFDHFDKHRLYFGANVVFASDDGGQSWRAISADLTREHAAVPSVLGSFESDDPSKGAHRGVVYAIAPSPVVRGTIWAGTDDGLVWLTRDASPSSRKARWKNVGPALEPWSKISQIEASPFDAATAYVAVNRFRLDDLRPYVYVTHDSGRTWSLMVNGLPHQPVNAVRQDPIARNLLYAATENGVYISFDDGTHWQPLQNNLPRTSVRDIIVHGSDLIVATHGRGFWILDDIQPLRELAASGDSISRQVAALFAPVPAYRVRRSTNTDTPLPPEEPTGENPPDGAIIDYALSRPAQHVTIAVYDSSGRLIRRFSNLDRPPAPIPNLDKPQYWEAAFERPCAAAGMHRFVWDLRDEAPLASSQDLPISAVQHRTPRVPQGPLVVPGYYTVELNVDGTIEKRTLLVRLDPRVRITQGELERQYRLAAQVAAMMNASCDRARAARERHQADLADKYYAINGDAAALLDTIDGADAPVTQQDAEAVVTLKSRLDGFHAKK